MTSRKRNVISLKGGAANARRLIGANEVAEQLGRSRRAPTRSSVSWTMSCKLAGVYDRRREGERGMLREALLSTDWERVERRWPLGKTRSAALGPLGASIGIDRGSAQEN